MQFNPPAKVRAVIYIGTALLTPVIGYLFDQHIIGTAEVALWGAEVTAVNIMAGLNVSVK